MGGDEESRGFQDLQCMIDIVKRAASGGRKRYIIIKLEETTKALNLLHIGLAKSITDLSMNETKCIQYARQFRLLRFKMNYLITRSFLMLASWNNAIEKGLYKICKKITLNQGNGAVVVLEKLFDSYGNKYACTSFARLIST